MIVLGEPRQALLVGLLVGAAVALSIVREEMEEAEKRQEEEAAAAA